MIIFESTTLNIDDVRKISLDKISRSNQIENIILISVIYNLAFIDSIILYFFLSPPKFMDLFLHYR
jgi:hypothetical protein